ncbi:hypothetical protein BC829DRAFT_424162 [Chytridium lagenaria]|nr:hypothetical protein BC829DRAFT_424162 [Chytridium lagenaria]
MSSCMYFILVLAYLQERLRMTQLAALLLERKRMTIRNRHYIISPSLPPASQSPILTILRDGDDGTFASVMGLNRSGFTNLLAYFSPEFEDASKGGDEPQFGTSKGKVDGFKVELDGSRILADSAFPISGALSNRIVTPLKEGNLERVLPASLRPAVQAQSDTITSIRQAAEWGMQAVPKVWRRLKVPLPFDPSL